MGLPLEQWRDGGEADGKDAAAGCRTPPGTGRQQQAGRAGGGDCPAAPRKRRAPAGAVTIEHQQQRRQFYNGADVEAFFAANNV